MNKFSEAIGWVGTTLVLVAYFMITFGYISAQDVIYPTMNIVAAIALGYSVIKKKAWAASGLQIIWGLIALVSLAGMIF